MESVLNGGLETTLAIDAMHIDFNDNGAFNPIAQPIIHQILFEQFLMRSHQTFFEHVEHFECASQVQWGLSSIVCDGCICMVFHQHFHHFFMPFLFRMQCGYI